MVNEKISMVADKINYNFEKKFYKISMFSDKNVNIKLIQWAILKNSGLSNLNLNPYCLQKIYLNLLEKELF